MDSVGGGAYFFLLPHSPAPPLGEGRNQECPSPRGWGESAMSADPATLPPARSVPPRKAHPVSSSWNCSAPSRSGPMTCPWRCGWQAVSPCLASPPWCLQVQVWAKVAVGAASMAKKAMAIQPLRMSPSHAPAPSLSNHGFSSQSCSSARSLPIMEMRNAVDQPKGSVHWPLQWHRECASPASARCRHSRGW